MTAGSEPVPARPIEQFDLLGPLPAENATTLLEASAGTGKTYALAGLVTRYIAEGHARLGELLLITFGRAASQELRDRVRRQLVEAHDALAGRPGVGEPSALVAHLLAGSDDERADRRFRLGQALAEFDAATIATTHQFCQLVLRSLGVVGDTDASVTLVENLDELVVEVADDLYLQHYAGRERPPFKRDLAHRLARDVVGDPHTRLADAKPDTEPGERRAFAEQVRAELERRKRRLGILGFDDLLGRLADALAEPDSPARRRMAERWRIVMVDEFQDTDPVQWDVIRDGFAGASTVILIGDPKQAIYAFRGGDIVTYLDAVRTARRQTLDVNYRSDEALVRSLNVVLEGAELGDPEIVVRPVRAHLGEHRLAAADGGPLPPFRLRVVDRHRFGAAQQRTIGMDRLREFVSADLAADVSRLLESGATYDHGTGPRPVSAGDIAVIVERHQDARAVRAALDQAGVPAVYSGDADIFSSQAAADWLALLEACDQPQRSGLVRAAALTFFFDHTVENLQQRGDELTDEVAETLRRWTDLLRLRGVAAMFAAAQASGLTERVLRWQGGERHITDLRHLAEILHERSQRERWALPALLEWLREETSDGRRAIERSRRLDSDARAVQVMTVWVSKGLQYPVVYLPFAFNRWEPDPEVLLYHDEQRRRCLDVGGPRSPGHDQHLARHRSESAGDEARLTYVALTRAQSQVVAWWAPSYNEPSGGLSRLLRGRRQGESQLPEKLAAPPPDSEALESLQRWQAAGGPVVETVTDLQPGGRVEVDEADLLPVRRFDRELDTEWRRTSYSGLLRAGEQSRTTGSEPEHAELDDEAEEIPLTLEPVTEESPLSPMHALPAGARFGSLVHEILEVADPFAADLAGELAGHAAALLPYWPVPATPDELGDALVPLHDTPLGPLAAGHTLRRIGLKDRLRELDFEIPLAGGDLARGDAADLLLSRLADLLEQHLAASDPMRRYATRLRSPGLGEQVLRGYLTGSIDVVLRVGDGAEQRFVVVDYKTNLLPSADDGPVRAADYGRVALEEAMLHSDYLLQALLYSVVVHRYLRWKLPGYDPERHLGGIAYLYLRGMCGPDTPIDDGHPAGVFSWRPPASLIIDLSDLLAGSPADLAEVPR